MNDRHYFIIFTLVMPFFSIAQSVHDLKNHLGDLNRQIDIAVVTGNFGSLEKWYANDFVFTHGTGLVDSKESWLKSIQSQTTKFLSREHDSINVELHKDIAIITGTLSVTKESVNPKGDSYGVRYVRVYALRKKHWQLISHRTVKEWHYNQLFSQACNLVFCARFDGVS